MGTGSVCYVVQCLKMNEPARCLSPFFSGPCAWSQQKNRCVVSEMDKETLFFLENGCCRTVRSGPLKKGTGTLARGCFNRPALWSLRAQVRRMWALGREPVPFSTRCCAGRDRTMAREYEQH
jgi:hypothetical protein